MFYITGLTTYADNKSSSWEQHTSITSCMPLVMDPRVSTFEVLRNENIRVFLDIDGAQWEDHKTIYQLATDFADFIGIPHKYYITYNAHSITHNGKSYHVIYDVVTTKKNLVKCIRVFNDKYPQYGKCIDETIYTKNRLFRLPYQAMPNRGGMNYESIHIPLDDAPVECFFIQDTAGKMRLDNPIFKKVLNMRSRIRLPYGHSRKDYSNVIHTLVPIVATSVITAVAAYIATR